MDEGPSRANDDRNSGPERVSRQSASFDTRRLTITPNLRITPAPVKTPAPAPVSDDVDTTKTERRWLRPLLLALLPIALVIGFYFYMAGGRFMSTENAYVRADLVGVSTDVSGVVKEINVRENQMVKAGDILFSLDDLPFRLALTRAEARIGIVAAQLNALKASYRDMQAQIQQAQADVDFNSRVMDRQKELIARKVASQITYDQAARNLQSSKQKVSSLTQQLAGITANLGGDPNIALDKHPSMIDAVAQRDEAARQLDHTRVKASISGVVTNVPALQPGQYLMAAAPAFSIVSVDRVWVEAMPKETELTYVKAGQYVTIEVDTYPDVEWRGTVDSVSPASSSSFALLPAQNTSGNWVKVVQRIPMRVRIETPADKPPLRVGMSVIVNVDTGHTRSLSNVFKGWFGSSTKPNG